MNLLKSPLRRTTAVVAGAFIGMAGAVAVAAPASAHHPIIDVDSSCVNADGTWIVNWVVANSERDLDGDITAVETAPAGGVAGITVGARLPKSGDGALTGVQRLPANVQRAKLKVTVHWLRNGQDVVNSAGRHKDKPGEQCKPTTPPPSSPAPSSPAPSSPAPSSPAPSSPAPSSPTPSPAPSSPAPSSPAPSVSPSTSPSLPPAEEPQFLYDETCDTFTVGLDVPASWPKSITVTFTPSTGTAQTVTVQPGDADTVDFPASAGLKVEATVQGHEDESASMAYTTPADCESAGGGAGSGDEEPTLPLTGAAAGGIAGGAGVLLALGGVLFLMARRRKVKFTA